MERSKLRDNCPHKGLAGECLIESLFEEKDIPCEDVYNDVCLAVLLPAPTNTANSKE